MNQSDTTKDKSYNVMLGVSFLVIGAICILLNFAFLPIIGLVAGVLLIVAGVTFLSHRNRSVVQRTYSNRNVTQPGTRPGKRVAHRAYAFRSREADRGAQSFTVQWGPIETSWDVFKPRAKEKWNRLSDDDLNMIAGHREMLKRKLEGAYGLSAREADAELVEFSLPENVT
jgi:uncharacterized protein YjbJ (UPF0337 family)